MSETSQDSEVVLEDYTVKPWGKYPRCRKVVSGVQCPRTTYSYRLCYEHCQELHEQQSQQS